MDVVVVGAGPAALSLAAACGEAGLRVRVLGGPDTPWVPNYGVWVDEIRAMGLGDYLAHTWVDTRVTFADGTDRHLGRAYGRVARRPLRAHLLARCAAAGVDVRWQLARSVRHDAKGSVVTDAAGEDHASTVVVDASGHRPTLLQRAGEPSAFQTAFGLRARIVGHPWDPSTFTMMDWSPVDDRDGEVPTFLYVMPFSDDVVFIEETSLVGPRLPFPMLEALLRRRMARMGLTMTEVADVEHCLIPMDAPVPDLSQRTLGFGAAAAFVHPATGYQLAASLALAPAVAASLAADLGRGLAPASVSANAWRVIWPASALAARELYLHGARALTTLTRRDVSSFFRTFMALPAAQRDGYLAGRSGVGTVAAAMWSTFLGCDAHLRRAVLRGGFGLPTSIWRATRTGNGNAATRGAS